MKLIMLGTGNAAVTKCYNTCFLLKDEERPEGDRCFLVDGGGGNGLFSQLGAAGIDWHEIHSIFVTHRHMDHIMGIIWMMRMILTGIKNGSYTGTAVIYGHNKVIRILNKEAELLLSKKDRSFIGKRLILAEVEDGETREIIGRRVSFFDMQSEKTKQFGFSMNIGAPAAGTQNARCFLTCCGDEPCSESARPYATHSRWLLHEAFCLYSDADRFKPYEKKHSTVKDACTLAEDLQIPNLVLYHTEDTNLANRKELYTREGRRFYSGNLYVPDDLETIELI